MKKEIAIGAIIIAVIVIGLTVAVYFKNSSVSPGQDGGGVVCTMEAKLCPDGSYVGRGGPLCEFAPCPIAPTPPSSDDIINVETNLNQSAEVFGLKITPLEVVEDSRCPVDVQCIQAGTVRVRASLTSALGKSETVFTLDIPVTTEAEVITLVDVTPAPYSTVEIKKSDYRFIFEISKRS